MLIYFTQKTLRVMWWGLRSQTSIGQCASRWGHHLGKWATYPDLLTSSSCHSSVHAEWASSPHAKLKNRCDHLKYGFMFRQLVVSLSLCVCVCVAVCVLWRALASFLDPSPPYGAPPRLRPPSAVPSAALSLCLPNCPRHGAPLNAAHPL